MCGNCTMKRDNWQKCYGKGWGQELVPKAYSHPAKVSRNLARRIYRHALEEGWLKEGDWVIDPFAGIGGLAYHALQHGINWLGCELEEKFVDLGNQNIALWNSRYKDRLPKWGNAVLLQGDSRKLAEVLGGAGFAGMISSPPYVESLHHTGHGIDLDKLAKPAYGPNSQAVHPTGYGRSEGQLAAMPEGQFNMAVSSPPYAGSQVAQQRGDCGGSFEKTGQGGSANRNEATLNYGSTSGNLAQLPEGDAPELTACISSPPWNVEPGDHKDKEDYRQQGLPRLGQSVGEHMAMLGSGDTFWSAARAIVQQVYQVLAPGGVAIWIVKAFVRNKAIVDFPGQWRDLCESVGFVTLHRHRAHLIEDRGTQAALIGEDDHRIRKHFSFFRRLHSQKYPHLEIKWEIVLCQQKP